MSLVQKIGSEKSYTIAVDGGERKMFISINLYFYTNSPQLLNRKPNFCLNENFRRSWRNLQSFSKGNQWYLKQWGTVTFFSNYDWINSRQKLRVMSISAGYQKFTILFLRCRIFLKWKESPETADALPFQLVCWL